MKKSQSNTSLKFSSPVVTEINELAKKLDITKELKKAYEIAETKEDVLEALKVIESAKQHLTDETKELCNNLNDSSICVTYSFAKKHI